MSAMSPPLPHRRLWSIGELSAADLRALLETAAALKQTTRRSSGWQPLRGRHLALLCAEPCSASEQFNDAVVELGGSVALLQTGAWRANSGDGVAEAARVLGRLYAAIDCCDLPPALVEQIDRYADVPVFNGLASPDHPSRLLCELLTMREASGRPLERLRVRLDGAPGSPLHRAAEALLSSSGCALHHSALATAGTSDGAAPDVDFVLDTSAPPACGRLVVPNAPAVEQARVNALLIDNQRCVLQASIVGVLG